MSRSERKQIFSNLSKKLFQQTVPDHGSWDRNVVLVRHTIGSGKPRGSGFWNGEGEVCLRATWDQGGQDRITPEEGFQVSKREWKGS